MQMLFHLTVGDGTIYFYHIAFCHFGSLVTLLMFSICLFEKHVWTLGMQQLESGKHNYVHEGSCDN
jgi:hypothetical protein